MVKALDLRFNGLMSTWVRIPLLVVLCYKVVKIENNNLPGKVYYNIHTLAQIQIMRCIRAYEAVNYQYVKRYYLKVASVGFEPTTFRSSV